MNNLVSDGSVNKFFQNSIELLSIADKKGVFIKLNPRWEKLLGYKTSELEGISYFKLIHTDDLKRTQESIKKLQQNKEVIDFTNRCRHKDGTYYWLEWSVFPDGDNLYFSGHDITRFKKSEEASAKGDAFFKSILQSIGNPILIVGDNGEVLHCNEKFIDLFEFPQELLDTRNENVLLEYAKKKFADPHTTLKKLNSIYKKNKQVNDTILFKDGRIIERQFFPLIEESPVKGGIWILKDVTHSKNIEEKLRISEERLRLTLETAQIGVWDWNVENDTWYTSPIYFTILGYEPEAEQQDRTIWLNRVHPEDRELVKEKINLVLTQKSSDYVYEVRMLHADGTYRWHQVTGHIVGKDNKGNITRMVGIRRDIDAYKCAEEKLKENQKLLTESQRIARMGSWELDVKNQTLYWNDGTLKILGLKQKEEQITLELFWSMILPEDIHIPKNHFEESIRTKKFEDFECRFKRPDKTIITIRISGEILMDTKGNPVRMLGTIQDITARKQKEEALRKSEKKYRLLFENMTSAFALQKMIFDDKGNAIDYIYEEINPVSEKYLGVSADIIIGKSAKELYPNTENYWIQLFGEVSKTGAPANRIDYSVELDKYLEASVFCPEEGYCASIFNDVTERIKNEETLNKFKASIDYSLDGIFWINSEAGFDYANEQACKILGYSKEELLRLKIFDIDPVATIDNFEILWDRLITNKRFEAFTVESKHKRKDGSLFPVESNSVFVWNNNKGLLISYTKDISERKQYEETLLKSQKLLNESQRIAAMGSWELNLNDNSLYWSDSLYKLYGIDKNKTTITQDLFLNLVHPDDREYTIKGLENTINTGFVSDDEIRIIRPDGIIRNLIVSAEVLKNEKGKDIRIIGVVQDITEKKEAAKALKESEQKMQRIFDLAPMGMGILKNRIMTQINPQVLIMTGYSPEELIGRNTQILYPDKEEYERVGKILYKEMEEKGIGKMETIMKRKDGKLINVYHAVSYIDPNEPSKGIISATMDITERKDYEAQIIQEKERAEESEQKLHRIFEFAPVGIGLLDKRVILDINSQVVNLTWYKKEELIGKKTEIVFPSKKEYEKVGKVMYEQLEKNGFSEFESTWKRRDGKLINVYLALTYLDLEAPSKGVLFTALDISKQKKVEEHLRKAKEKAEESEFFLRESQRNGKIGSFKMNYKESYWISTEILDEILGLEPAEKRTFNEWVEMVYPEDRDEMLKYYQENVIEKRLSFNKEYRIIRKNDNEIRWVYGNGKLYFDENGNFVNMLGTIQDVTERKLIEEERKRLNIELENRVKERTTQLQQANKDLESFAYSVSHDLRAPIRHINGFMNLLQRAINPMDIKTQDYIDKILLSAKNMSIMIDELLKLSRLGRTDLKRTQVNLSSIVNEIITQLKPDYEGRNIQWKISELPSVNGDPALLKIVFENLISNAIKYTAKKEEAIIEIGEKEKCSPDKICIFIKDNGAGFDIAYKDKLFGVFQRLHKKDEFEGTGVGLANVKQIIKKHNGEIDADAEINSGATFFITLPEQKQFG